MGLIPLLSSQRLALVTETSGGRWASSILWPALGQDGVCAEALLTRHDLTDPQHPLGGDALIRQPNLLSFALGTPRTGCRSTDSQ